ncbi:hypothetical protein P7K49_009719 [Saguinus oedipus]|uniref:Nuclear Testis protein N-terminal domain-containing protein n=1 Tax=Saguinus oedipus TaxID=9490 RepID=A0ABQ9VN27_SAGOE|nr:hypothetical protein P7K49_009719 [Saguinus oedipus]
MTLEEGMWRAMWEWQHRSNSERKIFYQMAANSGQKSVFTHPSLARSGETCAGSGETCIQDTMRPISGLPAFVPRSPLL